MKVSYQWLSQYLSKEITPEIVSKTLTSIGLEVSGIETFETIKGGLKGLVIGEVLTCEKHPNADSLSITTVNVGSEVLPIVCGAPNVAAGQKVVVATVGTELYHGDESFTIKKSKIRGETSEGMICAEDEIGLGTSHAGIMVLPSQTPVGTSAGSYFKLESDTILEVELTPNRIDAASHLGVVRDLVAYFQASGENISYQLPSVDAFRPGPDRNDFTVQVQQSAGCKRYSGLLMEGLSVKESPEWLKNRLKSIGLNPINNVVDVTNFVLHELGQPLHAFDLDAIAGRKIVVGTVADQTLFTTLDGIERKLNADDLMICNTQAPMCIAGVFGGAQSGVSAQTTSIFLESAYFDSVWVRKTAKRHGLSTDASFRFERGTDPNMTLIALKRAALLLQELAGGQISSQVFDIYPEPIAHFDIEVSISRINALIGEAIPKNQLLSILSALEIQVIDHGDILKLQVPPYRVDVQRPADIVEEVLRIYGYNRVAVPQLLHSSITFSPKPDKQAVVNYISDYLSSNGFNEMMANSLTKASYYDQSETFPAEQTVRISNPLSSDLNAMRQTLLFGALESIAYNINHKNADLMWYEWGNCSVYNNQVKNDNPQKNYKEQYRLALSICGKNQPESWIGKAKDQNFYTLKSHVEGVLKKLRIDQWQTEYFSNDIWAEGLIYSANQKVLLRMGIIDAAVLKPFDIDADVFYAEFDAQAAIQLMPKHDIKYQEVAKFPEVRRDLALLVDETVSFTDLKRTAEKAEKKLLKKVDIFDVYRGEKLAQGKKSYALSFIFQDETKTLNDKEIDKMMSKLIYLFQNEHAAQIR